MMKNFIKSIPPDGNQTFIFGMTPSFLVAPPSLRHSPFEEAVILITGHQIDGSMGFIINRPIGLMIKDLMDDQQEQDIIFTKKPIFFGGPVAKNSGFVLYEHEKNTPLAAGIEISDTLSISPARKMLEQAANGKLPGRFELILGYATWKRNQLSEELSRGGWLHLPFQKEIFFDVAPEDRWNHCFKSLGCAPYAFLEVQGGAQA